MDIYSTDNHNLDPDRISDDDDNLDETLLEDMDPDDIDPDDLLRHQCPILVTLAVMLMEVYFVSPFNTLAKRYNVDLGSDTEPSSWKRYIDVNVVFQACRSEIPDNSQFYLAVEHCLDPKIWEDEDGNKLENQTLRTRIYEEVVLPLETELGQAYSSISIDDLDRFAQKVDFANWDQKIQTWNQQAIPKPLQDDAAQHRGPCSPPPRPTMPHYSQSSPAPQPYQPHSQAFDNNGTEWGRRMSEPERRNRGLRSSTQTSILSLSEFEVEAGLSDLPASRHGEARGRWEYTVGILCALPKELFAVRALFDQKHNSFRNLQGDSNTYALGRMKSHLVVTTCLPAGEYGTNAAADSASNMKRSFPNIKFCLLVGIGGGAPSKENDIRLGDVVVSLPTTRFPGVIQYDRGKEIEDSTFELTGALQPPPRSLMAAISSLRSNPDLPANPLQQYLEDIVSRVPDSFKLKYKHPGEEHDELFKHACSTCRTHGECATRDSHLQRRLRRSTNQPEIHYGLIASGNRVIKDAKIRDKLAQEYGILCFEMEAAGVMNTFPCLVIRGICDYADSYKHKVWQEYAAAAAAAYAKLLLGEVAASETTGMNSPWDSQELL
ncbi:hypothetical protein G7Z17_g5837 [Cylindrodendrum hubeiense]|uniref:Nucleoside phosphorylase domain-containing protein n=1 Tax=Cylindrodendrum hubeiense TaxID=595255 RepID=A0A9P5L8R8_9HYPO|nr:hypothetical protein G7Z17_g5837 [Cylindrodendrum hubeiense]